MRSDRNPSLVFGADKYLLFLLFSVPPLFSQLTYVMLSLSSPAPGLVAISVGILLLFSRALISFRADLLTYFFIFACILWLLIAGVIEFFWHRQTDAVVGLAFLLVMLAAVAMVEVFRRVELASLLRGLFLSVLLFLFLGWFSQLFPSAIPVAYGALVSPVFPFSEPSHYALALGQIAVAYSFIGHPRRVLFLLLNLFLLAFFQPSLTLMVFSIMALWAFLCRSPDYRFWMVLGLLLVPLALFALFTFNSYFASRAPSLETDNLTALVFLQGWALAFANFSKNLLIGLGFQNLGSGTTELNTFSEAIYSLTGGSYLNLQDGGFLAAKVIAELGVFGILISLAYFVFCVWWFFRARLFLRQFLNMSSRADSQLTGKLLIAAGLVFGYFVEFFFRGYGYFSPGLLLVMASFLYLLAHRKHLFYCSESAVGRSFGERI
ncbi:hypothetical protein [uncultured Marinobacter sp.]|uniref:hypothetical protein n=1 Tax=uncultured Marinobacter sp. TaxID=187379 RepID=UPI0030C8BC22